MRNFTFLVCSYLLLLVARPPAAAQSGEQVITGRIKWAGTQPVVVSGQERRVPSFEGAQFKPGAQIGVYWVRLTGAAGPGRLRNAVYQAFTPAESRQLDVAALPAEPVVQMSGGTEMRQAVSYLALQPARRNPSTGQAEKLVSFEYRYLAAPTASRDVARTQRAYARASVLSTGDWFKIGVPASGVYKLDKKALRDLGLDVQNVDPRRLRLFGNATGMLPQANRALRPDDLVENAVYFAGDNNATFDDNEYLLFYAPGPHTWERDTTAPAAAPRFRHSYHLYTDTAYYFVTVGSTPGRRVSTAPAVTGAASAEITTFAERRFHERDLVNLLRSGRRWLGENFSNNTQTQRDFVFALPDLVPGSAVRVTAALAASSSGPTLVRATLNGQPFTGTSQQSIAGYSAGSYAEVANTALATFTAILPASAPNELRIGLQSINSTDPSANGYLDYLEVTAQRRLVLRSNEVLEFRSFENIKPGAVSRFMLSNAANAVVWDVTHPREPVAQPLASGAFVAATDTLREFVAFALGSNFEVPRNFGRVPNQNLHALLNLDQKLDMVIVAYPAFAAEARRLAAHRAAHDGLNVQVVTTTQVYNEFSSGGQDVTAIRDMMKMVYDRAPAGKRTFLLLFGDASFDYKADPTNPTKDSGKLPAWWFTEREPREGDKSNQNYVPVYESRESFAKIRPRPNGEADAISYSSDDYFGLLDDTEGAWIDDPYNTEILDVGVGRLPVRTPVGQPRNADQARDMVTKLINYDAITGYGKWRNRVTFVADDGDGGLHTLGSAEPLANALVQNQPAYNVRKVYLDLYPQTSIGAEQRSAACKRAIDEAIEQGSLIVNYSGHGGPQGWADEQILTNASVLNLQNRQRPTFLLTATCDFSTYDDPGFTSAGEESLTNTPGGAIGLLTTTRLVYQNANQVISNAFYETVFTPLSPGRLPRLGDVVAIAKNKSVLGPLNRNFALLGDPSMRLAYPEQNVVVREVNGKAVGAGATDTLRALAPVEIKGEVRQGSSLNARFNGTAQVTVYEKPTAVNTLGNEPNDGPYPITVQENIIYDGKATVQNGQFSLRFVVPKDINYSLGLGKISLYAADASAKVDAHGAAAVPVGGAANSVARDTVPPRIRLAMDHESFVFGGLTGTSPTLLSRLRDESGINTAGAGIGHEITATLDNDPSKLIILNDFYTAKADSFQTGEIQYRFKDLAPGPHVLRLKAWDTFNNSAEQEVEFIAANTEKLALQHVLNYPNPFSTVTTFHFDHNRSSSSEELDVQVQIFTVSGKLVRTLRTTAVSTSSHLAPLSWDGRDEFNDQLARGVYIYRVSVRSLQGGPAASKYEKLVLLN